MATPGLDLAFITVDDNKVTTDLERIKAWSLLIQTTYETTLPTNPTDGQEVYYAAAAGSGVIWHLRYRAAASGSYKWDVLGGPPLISSVAADESTTSTSYTGTGFTALTVVLPLAGDYVIDVGARSYNSGAGTNYMSYDIGGTGAVDGDSTQWNVSAAGQGAPGSRSLLKAGLAASTLTAKHKVSAGTGNFAERWIKATPVRLG